MLRAKTCMQRLHHLLVRHFHVSLTQTSKPPSLPIPSLLDAAVGVEELRQIHAHMLVTGIIEDPFAACRLLASPALVDFSYTHLIFSQTPHPDLFIWNTMIKKLGDAGNDSTCPPLLFYRHMLETNIRPNSHTFMNLIRALAARLEIGEGEEVHAFILKMGYRYSQFVSSALISLYSAVRHLDSARHVFDEMPKPGLILWTVMIRAYVCAGLPIEALELFQDGRVMGLAADSVSVATIVAACGQLGDLGVAMEVHGFITKSGIRVDAFVDSSLLNMYGDCGSLDLARQTFDQMPQKNVVAWNAMIHQCARHNNLEIAQKLFMEMPNRDLVSWNTLIVGFARSGQCSAALALFHQMEQYNMKPDTFTLSCVLSVCANLGALDTGTWIHAYIKKNNMNLDGSLDPGLIDMYSKCGSVEKALQVFEKAPKRDLFSWTSIICGLAMHGLAQHALNLFVRMLNAGIQPDDVTLVGVLNACAHAGLLDEGHRHFQLMYRVYNLTPKLEHYGCMIDLLGRMGHLREAFDLIMKMPMKPNGVVWGALLNACRVHNNLKLGEVVTERLLELDPSNPWARVMLSNMYAEAGKWDGVMTLRNDMKESGMKKTPGCSSIELNGTVHEFLIGDDSHAQHIEIHFMLERLEPQLKGA